MIGHAAVPSAATQAQAAYEMGWCRHCGRRLGYAGKCPNCDAWWRSAYIVFGLPLLLLNGFAIIAIVSRYGVKPGPDVVAHTPSALASNLTYSPIYSSGYAPPSPSLYRASAPSSGFSAFSTGNAVTAPPIILPDPWEVRLYELQNLRSVVWQAEGQFKKEQEQQAALLRQQVVASYQKAGQNLAVPMSSSLQ